MSSNARGRLAITLQGSRITLLLHNAARRCFYSSSWTAFERSKRNNRFYPFSRRELLVSQLKYQLLSKRQLVSSNPSTYLLTCASLGIRDGAPNGSIEKNSKWPRGPTVYTFCQRIRAGRGTHEGTLFHATGRQYKSSSSKSHDGEGFKIGTAENQKSHPSTTRPKSIIKTSISNKHIMDRLPNITHIHRPSKEELLAAATGFWSRLKVRFKWFSIRSARPFNIDEIGAFFSWILVGHVLWIILGTTTFFSLAIFAVNTVFAQGNSVLLQLV